jgi:steroid 5-alpha reductase family enzyme
MSRGKVALWLLVLAPVWPLLLALAIKDGVIPASAFGGLGDLYVRTHPLTSVWVFGLGYAALLYLVSLATGNASIFDVHWSLLPTNLYLFHFALHPSSHPDRTRAILVVLAVWLWGMRLTGNWLKKGGLGFEDFRYIRFRETMSPLVFQLFSFVSLFEVQAAMVLAMVMPAWYALRSPGRPVGLLDGLAFAIVLGAIAIEWIADLQGMAFRARREAHRAQHPEDLESNPPHAPKYPRFPREGLWRYSRHPNYFGEICVWWGVYLFSVAQSGRWLNWTLVGPLTINGLFLGGSVRLTEEHELRRKPEYADYQRCTSRLFPWWPKQA